jgi:hypothetical protein
VHKVLVDLVRGLRVYGKILVTGPQRSGTTIAAKIIAAELSVRSVDEREYGWNDPLAFRDLLFCSEQLVIQCPNFAHIIEQFSGPETFVVFMHRDPRAIIASQRRISWKSASYQRGLYRGKVSYLIHWITPVCVMKYLHWHFYQKPLVPHCYDLAYEALSSHPLWVGPTLRAAFSPKQTA